MINANTVSLWAGIVSVFVISGVAWGKLSTKVDVLDDEVKRTRPIIEQVHALTTDIKYIRETVAEVKRYLELEPKRGRIDHYYYPKQEVPRE